MISFPKYVLMFITGGLSYYLLECLWRGHSYGSMFLVAGACFLLIGVINDRCRKYRIQPILQIAITVVCMTMIEFVSGVFLNLYLGLGVWDYSDLPLNVFGQVCVSYMLLWIPLSFAAIGLDNRMKDFLFGGERVGRFRRDWKGSGFRAD